MDGSGDWDQWTIPVTYLTCLLFFLNCRSVQILPNQLLGSVGQHSSGSPVENMCLSHDRKYVITSSQESCYFWDSNLIPTLPPVLEESEEGKTKRRKRKRKQKHRDLETEQLARTKKIQQVNFFADLCN